MRRKLGRTKMLPNEKGLHSHRVFLCCVVKTPLRKKVKESTPGRRRRRDLSKKRENSVECILRKN